MPFATPLRTESPEDISIFLQFITIHCTGRGLAGSRVDKTHTTGARALARTRRHYGFRRPCMQKWSGLFIAALHCSAPRECSIIGADCEFQIFNGAFEAVATLSYKSWTKSSVSNEETLKTAIDVDVVFQWKFVDRVFYCVCLVN